MLDLTSLLEYAAKENASDVLITVGASPKIRVHGKLLSTNFSKVTVAETLETLLDVVTVEQRERFEAEGELDLSVSLPNLGRYRVNAYKQRGSISLAFRLVDGEIPDLYSLGMTEQAIEICDAKRGLVIVSGPSGSGKSTLIAAMIDRINSERETNIITLEDPIEYLHQHKNSLVNQREIGLDTTSYSKGLKAALKEDPDVLFVDNIPGPEVVEDMFLAAETGRLVITSMYTTSVVDTIHALVSMFPKEQQEQVRVRLAGCVRAIISRQLCEAIGDSPVVPAYGILIASSSVRKLLKENDLLGIKALMESGENGMTTLDQSLVRLYENGEITQKCAVNHATDPEWVAEQTGREE